VTLVDTAPADQGDVSGRLLRELEVEVRASYTRPSLDAAAAEAVIDPSVGLTVIGVGPDAIATRSTPSERWPVVAADGSPLRLVSRALELHLSADRTVGWSYDEVSIRLPVCGKVASIPLRVFQVYVRDAERWTLVHEHTTYAQPMGRWLDAARGADGARMVTAIERQPESRAAQLAVVEAVAADGDRTVWDDRPSALAVWPEPLHVMRGPGTRSGPSLAQSLEATAVSPEGLRLALGPGRNVAIVAATLLAKLPRTGGAVQVRLRASFVVERDRGERWQVRAALVSVPITVGAMVGRTVGVTATVGAGGRVTTSCP